MRAIFFFLIFIAPYAKADSVVMDFFRELQELAEYESTNESALTQIITFQDYSLSLEDCSLLAVHTQIQASGYINPITTSLRVDIDFLDLRKIERIERNFGLTVVMERNETAISNHRYIWEIHSPTEFIPRGEVVNQLVVDEFAKARGLLPLIRIEKTSEGVQYVSDYVLPRRIGGRDGRSIDLNLSRGFPEDEGKIISKFRKLVNACKATSSN